MLHTHSEYSLLDGVYAVNDLVEDAERKGYECLALTDHGTLSGIYHLLSRQKNSKIKLIPGIEAYAFVGKPSKKTVGHVTLLAPNQKAWLQLLKLHAESSKNTFGGNPVFDISVLLEKAYSDIVVMTACMKSVFAIGETGKLFSKFAERGNFFVEYMEHFLPPEKAVMDKFIPLAKKYSIPIIPTQDVHYESPKDAEFYAVLRSLSFGGRHVDIDTTELYMKPASEFKKTGELSWHKNKKFILDQFEPFGLPSLPPQLPEYPNADKIISKTAQEALKKYTKNFDERKKEIYKSRLKKELSVILKYGFAGYVLFIANLLAKANANGIYHGHGRGSACGSLLLFLMGITKIDPIEFNLKFERFLNSGRIKLIDGIAQAKDFPDVDLDFPVDKRDELFSIMAKEWGVDNVARISTEIRYQPKLAIRDTLRIVGVAPKKINQLLKGTDYANSIDEILELKPELKQILVNGSLKVARRLEGRLKSVGVHACGTVISPNLKLIPRRWEKSSQTWVAEWDLNIMQKLNFVKVDLLGLMELSRREEMLSEIERMTGKTPRISLRDKRIFETISRVAVDGLFQVKSAKMKKTLKKISPQSFEELRDAISLFRPGAKEFIDTYVKGKNEKPQKTGVKEIDSVILKTKGVLIYQEQVLEILVNFGFSLEEADLVRRAIGKKDTELLAGFKKKLFNQIKERGYSSKTAEKIWSWIEGFGGYGFNASHATAYAMHTFKDAAIATYYPSIYYASVINFAKDFEEQKKYMWQWMRKGEIIPPRLWWTSERFRARGREKILYGLKGVKGIAGKTIEKIMNSLRNIPKEEISKIRAISDPLEFSQAVFSLGFRDLRTSEKELLSLIGYFGAPELIFNMSIQELMRKQTEVLGFPVSPISRTTWELYKRKKNLKEYALGLLPVYILDIYHGKYKRYAVVKFPFEFKVIRMEVVSDKITNLTKVFWIQPGASRTRILKPIIVDYFDNSWNRDIMEVLK